MCPLVAVLLGLIVALSYGAGDFVGGLASRRSRPVAVVLASQFVGLVLLAATLLVPGQDPGADDLVRGLAAGAMGVVGVLLLYRGLAVGAMVVVAPITAVGSALVPLAWGLATGERPGALALAGAVLAMVAVGLVATPSGERDEAPEGFAREVALALVAGAAFGGVFVLLGDTSSASGLWPVAAARVASVSLAAVAVLVTRTPLQYPRGSRRLVVLAGIFDAGANAAFVIAAREGLLSLVAPVSALYPAATVALAAVFLHERTSSRQRVGLALAVVAVVSIAS
jgi:drug/metabolite transporter (DMT)-like permease